MLKVGILSDTHCTLIPQLFHFFKDVDELWHAGDIGNIETADALANFKPLRAVHGNIDDYTVRRQYPEDLLFNVEDTKVFMTHIGGYPDHYMTEVKHILIAKKPDLFICGHSHILKVMYDKKLNLLHINPGAAGNSGFHKKITFIRMAIEGKTFKDMEIFELDRHKLI
jgi:putative phosphoesterase